MRTALDRTAEIALLERLREGPADRAALLAAVRARSPHALDGAEGAIHALLHRIRIEGGLVAVGRAADGGSVYAARVRAHGAVGAVGAVASEAGTVGGVAATDLGPSLGASLEPLASHPDEPIEPPPPAHPSDARAAARVASRIRDDETRGRMVADVLAHLATLRAAGRVRAFGPVRALAESVRRVDRRRSVVVLAPDAVGHAQRFLVQEAPQALLFAAAVALVWVFLAEPRVVPTHSMEPTLSPGDRVLVEKVSGGVPPRFSICVFRRADDVVLVKRLVGLPGESILLVDGDAFANGVRLVKPDDVDEGVREPLLRETPGADGRPSAAWALEPGRPAWWRYASMLYADEPRYRDAAGMIEPQGTPRPIAHDVYVLGVVPAPGASLGLAVEWQGDGSMHAPPVRGALLRLEGGALTVGGLREEGLGSALDVVPGLPAGERVEVEEGDEVELAYVDGFVRVRVGSRTWRAHVLVRRGGAAVSVSGPWRRVAVDRDLHWTAPFGAAFAIDPATPYVVPPDHLFFLGDHSSNSRDSRFRELGPVPVSRMVGRVAARFWPPSRWGRPR